MLFRSIALLSLLVPFTARADCAPPTDEPPMCLVGTITAPDYAVAFIELPGTPGVETVKLDGTIADWQVSKILPRSIVVSHGTEQVSLALAGDGAAPPAAVEEVAPSASIAEQSLQARLRRKQEREGS